MSPFNSNYNSRLLRKFPTCTDMEAGSSIIMPIWFEHCNDDICQFIPGLHNNLSNEIEDSIFTAKVRNKWQ